MAKCGECLMNNVEIVELKDGVCPRCEIDYTGTDCLKAIRILQDGQNFYNDWTGQLLYKSSVTVKDFDLRAARQARAEFIDFATRQGWTVEF